MLTLMPSPELERRLQDEAAKRGLQPSDYALRLLQSVLDSPNAGNLLSFAVGEVTLEQLLQGVTDENLHHEVETGAPVGDEAW